MIWVLGVLIAIGGGDGSGVVSAPRSYRWLQVGNIVCVHIHMYVSTHTYVYRPTYALVYKHTYIDNCISFPHPSISI